MRTQLIVNPSSNKGRALALVPQITATLQQLGVEFDLTQTKGPGHATELVQQAAAAGYDRVVAVGGDGTCNEMVNGLLTLPQPARAPSLGVIPSGSGNDWACSLKIPLDMAEACRVLQCGSERLIDVGRVTVDGQSRLFANVVGLGFDAEVAVDTKRPSIFRGFAMYLWSVLRVMTVGRWPYQAEFCINGRQRQQSITLLTVGNGTRSGGGFLLTPQAELDDGLFDICYASGLSRWSLLNLLPKAIKGTHLGHPAVTMARADKLEVSVEAGIPGHIDGEILCVKGRRLEFEILPQALRVWL